MERLTQRDENNIAYWDGKNGKSWSDKKGYIYGGAITKLAEYEDIGLTPEQILTVDKLYTEKCEELARYKKLEEQGDFWSCPAKKEHPYIWLRRIAEETPYTVVGAEIVKAVVICTALLKKTGLKHTCAMISEKPYFLPKRKRKRH